MMFAINMGVEAQEFTGWKWASGFDVQIPDDMEVKINTDEQFEASNDYLLIHIDFFDRNYVSDERVAEAMKEVAENNGIKIADVTGGALEGDTMGGAFLQGSPDDKTTLKIMGLVGKGKSFGCLVDLYYDNSYEETVQVVMNKITYSPEN